MSSKITIKSSPALAYGGLVSIIIGLLMVFGGAGAWAVVSQQLANERIYVAEDAPFLKNRLVNDPLTAFSQAVAINDHALAASGGKTYAELAQDDPTRQTVMNAAFLRSSLFTSVVSFGVALLASGAGVVFVIVGWSLRKASFGNPVVVETDTPGPVQVENTRGDLLQGEPREPDVMSSSTLANIAPVIAAEPVEETGSSRRISRKERRANQQAEASAASQLSTDGAQDASVSVPSAAFTSPTAPAVPVVPGAPATSTAQAEQGAPVEPQGTRSPAAGSADVFAGNEAAAGDTGRAEIADRGARRPITTVFPNVQAAVSADSAQVGSAGSPSAAVAPPSVQGAMGSAKSAPTAGTPSVESATSSPTSGAPLGVPTRVSAAEIMSTKPATLPTPVVAPQSPAPTGGTGFPPFGETRSSGSAASTRSAISTGSAVSARSARSSNSAASSFSAPSATTGAIPVTRSSRTAASASTGSIPTIPSFDDLIAPGNSASLSSASRSERALNDSLRRIEEEKTRSGMTGTIPIVGAAPAGNPSASTNVAQPTPGPTNMGSPFTPVTPAGSSASAGSADALRSAASSETAGPDESDASFAPPAHDPRPITGAVSWQSPEDRLK